jgi:hypothetical protein
MSTPAGHVLFSTGSAKQDGCEVSESVTLALLAWVSPTLLFATGEEEGWVKEKSLIQRNHGLTLPAMFLAESHPDGYVIATGLR